MKSRCNMAKEVDSIHLLSCAIEASLGNDFPAFAFRLPGEDGFYWGACEPDRLMTLADGVFRKDRRASFSHLLKKASCLVTFSL